MADERSELERRLREASHHSATPMFATEVMREAAGAIGECRRAMRAAQSAIAHGNRDLSLVRELNEAVLARLEGVANGPVAD